MDLWIISHFIFEIPNTCKKTENQQSSARICTSDKEFLLLSSSLITQCIRNWLLNSHLPLWIARSLVSAKSTQVCKPSLP